MAYRLLQPGSVWCTESGSIEYIMIVCTTADIQCGVCSPLLSGVRVLKPKLKWWPTLLDVFPNFRLIQQVEASTLIIHGTQDEVIDVDHGKRLHELAKNPYPKPLWANGYTHQNISTCPEYIPHIQRFLRDL